MEESKFNFNAKNIFLTYAQVGDARREDLLEFLQKLFSGHGVRRWVLSTESHADGGRHFHGLFCLLTKYHTRSVRKFDWNDLHPNIKTAGTPDELYYYIIKDGDFVEDWTSLVVPTDYRKRRADIEAFELEQQIRRLKSPFPFNLPDGGHIDSMPQLKCRHYWYVGRADWGKTRWVNETFEGKAIYLRPAAKYPYEGYSNEDIIVFDDVKPDGKEELCSITNTFRINCQIYGDTRYTRKYWKCGHDRLIIIFSNIEPEYNTELWFRNRFNLVFLR